MKRCTLLGSALFALLLAGPAAAHSEKTAPAKRPAAQAVPSPGGAQEARAYFTDLELRTQDNKPVRFYTDAMEGKTVVINFIYTNCKDACPLITQKMLQVREVLGDKFNKDVFYVTVTTDPLRDTPAELKKFAQKQSADMPGWLFLTGSPRDLELCRIRFGFTDPDPELDRAKTQHTNVVLLGNEPNERWMATPALTNPEFMLNQMSRVAGWKVV